MFAICKSRFRMILLATVVALLSGSTYAEDAKIQPPLKNKPPMEDIQRFTIAIGEIKHFYVKDVNDQKLFEDAIRGMVAGLDPHSAYLDANDYEDLQSMTSGQFGGLGIEITMDDGLVKVISPIDDSPAQKAGLAPGDLIIKIDQKPVKGMTIREAVNAMRGPKDSKVDLVVLRSKTPKPLVFHVTRDVIHVKSVKAKLLEDNIGYIRIASFQEDTEPELQKAISKLQKNAHGKLAGVILDLRNNPGGLLDAAIGVSNDLMDVSANKPKQLIVYTQGRSPNSRYNAYATPSNLLKSAPIVVLVNGGSASGSEIVAGALQDNKRAVLVGTKSFGKGSVQTVFPLDKNHAIKLTTALYYTPSGRSIQAKGIEPDITVEPLKVSVQKAETDEDQFGIKEADLKGHFSALEEKSGQNNKAQDKVEPVAEEVNAEPKSLLGSNVDKAVQPAPTAADQLKRARTDYQLYTAVNVLKGLVMTRK